MVYVILTPRGRLRYRSRARTGISRESKIAGASPHWNDDGRRDALPYLGRMSLPSEHKALLFLGAIAALGAGVRVARATGRHGVAAQPALEQQVQAADSAKRAGVARKRARKSTPSAPSRAATVVVAPPARSTSRISGRLDLDVATAAQIDSLPGVGPALARRIVVERMSGGPFTKLASLRRVKGVTAKLLERVDSLVTFSGTVVPPNSADTVIPPSRRSRASRPGDGA